MGQHRWKAHRLPSMHLPIGSVLIPRPHNTLTQSDSGFSARVSGPRIKTGLETLVNSALKGKGNMGPQGGGDFSDFEIARAVVYMANNGGAKFDEPKMPAPAASAAQ